MPGEGTVRCGLDSSAGVGALNVEGDCDRLSDRIDVSGDGMGEAHVVSVRPLPNGRENMV